MRIGAIAFFLLSQGTSDCQLVFLNFNQEIAVAKACNRKRDAVGLIASFFNIVGLITAFVRTLHVLEHVNDAVKAGDATVQGGKI